MGSVAYPSTFMDLRWVTTRTKKDKNKNNPKELNLKPAATIPVYISTNPSDINLPKFRDCNHSCYRFSRLDPEEPVDVDKLRVTLSHSCALVSLFSRPLDCFETDFDGDIEPTELSDDGSKKVVPLLGNLMDRLIPVSSSNGKLVGFGRAVSDVIPSLRRLGIGQMIVRRIVRMLTSRDIYDISSLCSEDERITMSAGPSIGGSIEPGRQISSCFKPIELGLELIPDAAGQSHDGNKKHGGQPTEFGMEPVPDAAGPKEMVGTPTAVSEMLHHRGFLCFLMGPMIFMVKNWAIRAAL